MKKEKKIENVEKLFGRTCSFISGTSSVSFATMSSSMTGGNLSLQ